MFVRNQIQLLGILSLTVSYFSKTWKNLAAVTTDRDLFKNHLATAVNRPRNIYHNGTDYIVNPWYGWQPPLHTPTKCSWLQCTSKKYRRRVGPCGKDCRDSPYDLKLNITSTSNSSSLLSLDPGEDWVPDATMLRRMFIDGHDADGNPWPPPLDDDLCELSGNPELKSSKELFDRVPIIGAPISREESQKSRVLCMVYTIESSHANKIRAIRETWAPGGCDGFVAFSNKADPRIPAIKVNQRSKDMYEHMWQKVRAIFQFVGKHYMNQFDWFYIGGDDLLVFPQTLKNYLATYNSSHPKFLGRRFRKGGKEFINGSQGFNTGGPGYALSRPALQCFLEHIEDPVCMPTRLTSMEDVMIAQCLEHACNITYEETRDEEKRHRFHHFSPEWEYNYRGRVNRGKAKTPAWYEDYNKEWGIRYGKDCCSPETTSFHNIKVPGMMRYLFHYAQNCNRSAS